MSQTTNLNTLTINKLTKAQYQGATLNPNELYSITDDKMAFAGDVPQIPSQSGQSGKFLTTNGSAMSWTTVLTPSNGEKWYRAPYHDLGVINNIVYVSGNSHFIAGTSTGVWYSSDGFNWSSTKIKQDCWVAYGNNYYVALLIDGVQDAPMTYAYASSVDGNWTKVQTTRYSDDFDWWEKLYFCSGVFLVCSYMEDYHLAASNPSSASNWSWVSNLNSELVGIASSPTRTVAIGGPITPWSSTTTDGTNWTLNDNNPFGSWYSPCCIAYGSTGDFIAIVCDDGNRLHSATFTSSNGSTWTKLNEDLPWSYDFRLFYDNGKYIVIGGSIWTSVDGSSWTEVTSPLAEGTKWTDFGPVASNSDIILSGYNYSSKSTDFVVDSATVNYVQAATSSIINEFPSQSGNSGKFLTTDGTDMSWSDTPMIKGTDYVTAGRMSGTALGTKATAEGYNTTASGWYSHAEGYSTVASGDYSHAEGSGTTASGPNSHAEGYGTIASGEYSHAEGRYTTASGDGSHAGGYDTAAQRKSQHVFGEYNVLDTTGTTTTRGQYVEIVGNGTADDARSNARTLDWSGNEVLAGKLTVGTAPTNNMDVATKQYVDGANFQAPIIASGVLQGDGNGTITARSVTNNTSTSTSLTANTNLITANTLRYHTNRTTSVAAADTNYTTYMARGTTLNSTDTNPTVNGTIAWTYE